MANTTVKGAVSIHGRNPQFLIEEVIRLRIYDSIYWKEQCFALTAESVIDKAVALRYIGGTYANTRPTEFLCLALKLLQLQPEKEIILEYLRAEEFKYLRALAVFYVRLTFSPINVYLTLEPLLLDYRKLRKRSMDGAYHITTMDDFADALLTEERVCDVILPRLTLRRVLEDTEGLEPRRSQLATAMGVPTELVDRKGNRRGSEDEEEDDDVDGVNDRFVSRSPTPESDSGASNPDRYLSRSPSSDRFVSKSPTPEPESSNMVET